MKKPVKGSFEDDDVFRIRLIEWDSKNHQILTWLRNTSIPSISNLLGLGNFDDTRQTIFLPIWHSRISVIDWTVSNLARPWPIYQWFLYSFPVHMGPTWSCWSTMGYSQWCNEVCYPSWSNVSLLFLMALHDDYEPVCGQLLHQIPTPSLDAALNELIREETRLQTLQAQKKNSMSWLLHPLLHHFSILNLISLAPILVVQIGNPTNFVNIARNMATLLRLIIAVIETLLLLLILI